MILVYQAGSTSHHHNTGLIWKGKKPWFLPGRKHYSFKRTLTSSVHDTLSGRGYRVVKA